MKAGPKISWDGLVAARGLNITLVQHLSMRQNGRKAAWLVTDWLTCNLPGVKMVSVRTGFMMEFPPAVGRWQLRLMTKELDLSRSEGKGKGRSFSLSKQNELGIYGWLVVDCQLLPDAPSWWLNIDDANAMIDAGVLNERLNGKRKEVLEYMLKQLAQND